MAEKKGFLLRLNPEMLAELERWAQDEFRSVNGQIEYLLNEALKKQRRGKKGSEPPPTDPTTDQ
ncbi:hypothetical protein FAES_0417 [Fibrella aestuarina BUZ 2]|uniref:Arc-like DNA binding domain-containing protein n=1 Tax=Fibrella aestuarina BUZ 2 TaxID=1166018 RepID=I0K2S6_9BACT|nr:Arc family DNA-binding protein [Fibrella aestuarina]CCG98429.1 hypothetical protein FAES_0417 [Fibrella aestuarina BUZ 2]